MELVRSIARPLLGWVFVSSGVDVLRNPHPRAEVAGPVIDKVTGSASFLPDDRVTMVRANAAVMLGAGTMLALGKAPRLAALALVGSMIPTTVGGHRYWEFDDPAKRAQNRIHFNKNLAIIGGLLMAASERRR
jgi:putative oxidoreductase